MKKIKKLIQKIFSKFMEPTTFYIFKMTYNYNIWHYDDDFYISIKKDENNIINVYYSCLTCKNNDYNFLIDKTIVNIFELNNNIKI